VPPRSRLTSAGPEDPHPRILPEGDGLPPELRERLDEFTGRGWVLDAVDAWLESPTRTLLITGTAGTGKSTVAARLAQVRELAYAHFCRAGDDATLDPLRFLERLGERLAAQVPGFAEELASEAKTEIAGTATAEQAAAGAQVVGVLIRELHVGSASPRLALDRLLRRPLERAGAGERIVVLVDALDEALTYGDENLVALLSAASELPGNVRFLLTSRPDQRVLRRIEHTRLDLVEDAPADDVRAYASERLGDAAVADRVAEAADGNFLYARYVVDDLLADPARDPEARSLPKGLEGHYHDYLERELVRSDERWEDRYRPLLGLLAVARGDGLPRELLAAASGIEEDRTDDALRVLGQYLSGPADGPFRLYHQSFREFLLEGTEHRVYPALAARRLAETLLDDYPDHSYAIENAPTHLVEALTGAKRSVALALLERLQGLLADPGFLGAKLRAHPPGDLLADFDLALDGERAPEFDAAGLAAVRDALRLSTHILGKDADELPTQLWARLRTSEGPAVEALRAALSETRRPWLRPYATSVIPAGHPMRMTLSGMNCVNGVVVAPDASVALCHDDDSTLWLWELRSGALRRAIETAYGSWLNCSAGHPELPLAVVVKSDGGILVVDLERAELLRELPSEGDLKAIAISPDGRSVWTAHSLGRVLSRPIEGGDEVRVADAGWDDVGAIVAAGSQTFLAAGGQVEEWDLQAGERVRRLGEDGADVESLAVAGDRLAVGREDGGVELWDLAAGTAIELAGHRDRGDRNRVAGVAFAPDGRLVSGAWDETLRVWDREGRQTAVLRGHSMSVYDVATFGSRAISVSKDGTARVWDLDAEPSREPDLQHDGAVDAVAVRGGTAVSGSRDRRIAVWDAATGTPLRRWDAHAGEALHEGWIQAVAVSPGGDLVHSAASDGTLRSWAPDGAPAGCVAGGWGSERNIALAADEPVAAGLREGSRDVVFRRPDRTLGAVTIDGLMLKFGLSADAAVAVAADENQLHVVDAREPRVLWSAAAAEGRRYVDSVAVAADGTLAVIGLPSGTVEVWDLAARELRHSLPLHGLNVVAAAISPDGTLACTAGWDWALRVWDVATGAVIASYSNDDWWASCTFTEDGRRLVAGDERGGVHFLALET
jgi:WD40 repeat protein